MAPKRKAAIVFGSIVCAALVAAAAFAYLWMSGSMLPEWTQWSSIERQADFDGDGICERVSLHDRKLAISHDDGLLFESPESWFVSDVRIGDVNHDNRDEVVALLWKRGSYGPDKPFWASDDQFAYSQHICVYAYENATLRQLWMSSAVGMQIARTRLDASSRLRLIGPDDAEVVCEWRSWGFTLVDDAAVSAEGTKRVSFIAVGDNIAHTSVYENARDPESGSFDFSPVYKHVASRISEYDIAAVNQETVFVQDVGEVSGYPRFGTPQQMGDALVEAGFDVVCAATNHANDKGEKALRSTLSYWKSTHPEIELLGLHASERDAESVNCMEVNGIKIALLDYTYGLNGRALSAGNEHMVDVLDGTARFERCMERAERTADITICFLHVGEEYSEGPDVSARTAIERAIDAGADVVICTHPHAVQPVERVTAASGKSALVYYSLGNFMANQLDERTVVGAAADLVIEKASGEDTARVSSYSMVPLVSHFTKSATEVYFLDDYTDDLAHQHEVRVGGQPLSCERLQQIWKTRSGWQR